MKKRLLAFLLSAAMAITLLPTFSVPAEAATESTWEVGDTLYDDRILLSETAYQLAPGITEYDTTTNNSSGTSQNIDYFCEVDADTVSAMVMAGYADYDGSEWSMQRITDQAAAAQAQFDEEGNGYKVVAVLNADFYNMSTGEPQGVLVMNGTVYKGVNGRNYFAILNDGTAVIRTSSETDLSDVAQAVGGDAIILKDGVVQIEADVDNEYYAKTTTRTAIGIKEDGTVVTMVCHGNVYPTSSGYNYYSVACMLKARGCVDAIMLDGSGSSSFASMREGEDELTVRNSPSDGGVRQVSSSIMLVTKAKSDGEFDHATLSPNNEVYTPNSEVQFTAKGVDSAGSAATLPDDVTWKLADDSYGTIDENGLFVSNGTTGEVKVQLYYDGSVVGTTTVIIAEPTSITFASEELTMGFSEESTLGLTVRYNGRSMNIKDGDIVWTLSDEGLGTFDGNTFISSDEDTISGTITATSAYDSSISGSVAVEVGKLPSIVMDFEDYTDEDGNVTEAEDYWTVGRVCSVADNKNGTAGIIEAYSDEDGSVITDQTEIDKFYLAHRLLMLHYGAGSTSRGAKCYANLISKDDSEYADIIRFGNNALEVKYDFSNITGIEGACVGFTEDVTVSGHPTGIGIWIYCPEDTPNLWLRLRVATKNSSGELTYQYMNFTQRMDTAYNDSSNTTTAEKMGGIAQYSGQGWVYLECDVSSLTDEFVIPAGEAIRFMHTNGAYGPTSGLGMGDYLADGTVISRSDCVGSIYIDNMMFVYGTNDSDTVAPTISTFTANGEELEDGLVLTDNTVDFTAYFADDTGRYASGIDYDNGGVHLFIDGVNYTDSAAIFQDGTLRLDDVNLKNGTHTARLVINDADGNKTTKEVHFLVKAENNSESLTLVAQGEAILGHTLDFNLELPTDVDAETVTMTVSIDKKYKDLYEIAAATGYELVSSEYSVVNHSVTMEFKSLGGRSQVIDTDTGDVVVGTISFEIPTDLSSGSYFSYTVTAGQYTDADGNTGTYSTETLRMPVTALYEITSDIFVTGLSGNFYVTDESGTPVAGASVLDKDTDEELGTTDENGVLTIETIDQESYHVYAMKDDDLSFDITVDARAAYGNEDGTPETITVNAAGVTSKKISWFANPSVTKASAQLQYTTTEDDFSNATTVTGDSTLTEFYGDEQASRINSVTLSGLAENTTYYYRVGDGEIWSDVQSLTTGYCGADANLFVLADLQDENTDNIEGILATLSEGDYDLGVQLGDLVEEPYMESQWLTALNLFTNVNTDMLHVIGNHELFGDSYGDISAAIYGREMGCYSVEYGNVYVATIPYSDGTANYEAAAEWLIEDAAKSTATWKLLMIHQPAYYTNTTGGNEALHEILPAAAEEAGIDFVFSGHDHSYARTAALKGGEVDEDGVVYYICGSTGAKSYIMTDNEDFHFETLTQDYDAIYLTIATGETSITVTTWNYKDGASEVLETYTKEKTACEEHSYVCSDGRMTCEKCGYSREIGSYTGFATDKASGKTMYYISGVYQTGYFAYGDDVYHFGDDGLAHEIEIVHVPTTCTERGTITYNCECGWTKTVKDDPAPGHEYVEQEDGSYVCSVCGNTRIELEDCTITWPYTTCTYYGEARTPYPTVVAPDGTVLEGGSVDFYVNWEDNDAVGTAKAIVTAKSGYNVNLTEWRGAYGGQVTIEFKIVPDVPDNVQVTETTNESATVTWDAVGEATAYRVYKSTDGEKWTLVDTVEGTSYTVEGLTCSTDYQFAVRSVTTVDGEDYVSLKYSDAASTTTEAGIDLTGYTGTLSYTSAVYSGTAKKPGVAVTAEDGTALEKGTDYTVEYADNVNVGTATATITGKGGYIGSFTLTYQITQQSLINDKVVVTAENAVYTGQPIETAVTVTDRNGIVLTKDTDYTVSYANNVDVGTATVTVTGKGNYKSSTSTTFEIGTLDISDLSAALAEDQDLTYTGKEVTPEVVVEGLTAGTDYTVTYKDNVDAGTATAIVTGAGNCIGSIELTYEIVAADIADATIVDGSTYSYTGSEIIPDLDVTAEAGILEQDKDYEIVSCVNNIEVGTATVTIQGIGNYTGTTTHDYQIQRADLSAFTIALDPGTTTYDGTAKEPVVIVNTNNCVLTEDTDYTVEYVNNTDAGTAAVIVTGIGSYTGTAQRSFTIAPADITDYSAELAWTKTTYTGAEMTPEAVVEGLTAETDYTVTYKDNVNAGTATATVTGIGNYTGSIDLTYEIEAADISAAEITNNGEYIYTGSAITPDFEVKSTAGVLEQDKDYKVVSYENNVNVGTATMTIQGIGNYTGTAVLEYQIQSCDLSAGAVELDPEAATYNGKAQEPAVAVSLDERVLTAGTDYTVTYANNTEVGTATVTVTGKGGYTGKVQRTFEISRADIKDCSVKLSWTKTTYSGTSKRPTPTVTTADGTKLVKGTDYTVAYADNKNAGTATVTITGEGNYTGTLTTTFTIRQADLGKGTLTLEDETFYATGEAVEPAVTVKTAKGTTLVEGKNYTVSYADNTEAGTATVTVTGIGNYTGTLTKTFTIKSRIDITESTATLKWTKTTYTGSEKCPGVTVKTAKGTTLKKGTNYTVAYSDNVEAGIATVTITGIGKYTGTITKTFTIRPVKPTNVSATATKTTIKVSFDRHDSADKYYIYIDGEYAGCTVTKDYYTIKGLTAGTTHKVSVKAVKEVDGKKVYSLMSTSVSITTKG